MPKESKMPDGWLSFAIVDRGFETLNNAIRAAVYVGIAYFTYLTIKELAGHQTVANFVFGYFTDGKGGGTRAPWVMSTLGFGGWGAWERWLRHRKVATMSGRLKELEKLFDVKRTSSGLDESGRLPSRRSRKS